MSNAAHANITVVMARGGWGTVECVVLAGGNVPARDFLTSESEELRARFALLFQQMANYGSVSPKRFKKEMGKLYAFRHEVANRQIRFPCFSDGNKWVLTHGFIKPGAKKKKGQWPQSEVARAEKIREDYFSRKQ